MKTEFKWEKGPTPAGPYYFLTLYLDINKTHLQPSLACIRRNGEEWQVVELLGDYHPEDYTYPATLMGPYKTLKSAKTAVEKKIKKIIRAMPETRGEK